MALTDRHRQPGGEALSPFTGHRYASSPSVMIPGFRREPRPLLSFIIRVINRTNREQIRQQLKSFLDHDFQGRSPADQAALDRLGNEPALLNDAADRLIAGMREMADMW